MAGISRIEVYQRLSDQGILPLFYHPDADTCYQVAAACYRAGARILEFTNRGDFAHETFADLVKRCRRELPGLSLGIGSIQDAGSAALFMQSGADFVVTPLWREDVVRTCNRRKIAVIPGVSTPTEIGMAEEMGCEMIKLSPGEVLGPAFLRAHLGPCPWTRALVSGGVTRDADNLHSWLEAGAICLGMGSKLISKEMLAGGDFGALERDLKDALDLVRQWHNRK